VRFINLFTYLLTYLQRFSDRLVFSLIGEESRESVSDECTEWSVQSGT